MEVTVEDAAAVLGVSEQYVRRLAKSGRLPARRGSGGQWFIQAESLQNSSPVRSVDSGRAEVAYLPDAKPQPGPADTVARLTEENAQLRAALAALLPLVSGYLEDKQT